MQLYYGSAGFMSSLPASAQPAPTSTNVSVMGGMVNNKAWTGGKPLADWSGLNPSSTGITPHTTQICATSSKASMSMTKSTKGLFKKKGVKFKHGNDLAYFNNNLFEHF